MVVEALASSCEAPLFYLSQRCRGHQKGIRSCCQLKESSAIITGSWDGCIGFWTLLESSDASYSAKDVPKPTFHLNFSKELVKSPIYSLCEGLWYNDGYQQGSFFAGTSQHIYWVDLSGSTLHIFKGHQNSICSLTLLRPSYPDDMKKNCFLVSGSWDGTARVWDLAAKQCLHCLSGHSYAVTVFVVSYRCTHYIVTGSQDKTLHFWCWNDSMKLSEVAIPHAHQDIIRGFALLSESQLLSCSNDGYVNTWDLETTKLLASNKLHDTFIFDICVLNMNPKDSTDRLIVSSSEDCTCRIWSPLIQPWILLQTVKHPSTVWKSCVLSNNDLITICEDGLLRVWTQTQEFALPLQEQLEETPAVESINPSKSFSSGKTSYGNLPSKEMLMSCRGNFVKENRLCRDNSTVVAMQWDGERWQWVGEVESGHEESLGEFYEGDSVFSPGWYHYLLQVQIESNPTIKPLPFRRHDNPVVAAEAFCARENLSKSYVSEIVQFIRANCDAETTNTVSLSENSLVDKKEEILLRSYIQFSSVNIKGLRERLNMVLVKDGVSHVGLPALHQDYLLSLVEKVQSSSFMQTELRKSEMDVLFAIDLQSLPVDCRLPIMDLRRILVLHPQSSKVLNNSDLGRQVIVTGLKEISEDFSHPTPLTICCYRFLANFFVVCTNRVFLWRSIREVMRVMEHPPLGVLAAINSWMAVLHNISLALCHLGEGVNTYMNVSSVSEMSLTEYICVASGQGILSLLKHQESKNYNITLLISLLEILIMCALKQNLLESKETLKALFRKLLEELRGLTDTLRGEDFTQELNRLDVTLADQKSQTPSSFF